MTGDKAQGTMGTSKMRDDCAVSPVFFFLPSFARKSSREDVYFYLNLSFARATFVCDAVSVRFSYDSIKTETTFKSVDIGLDNLNGPIFLICNYIIPLVHGKQP